MKGSIFAATFKEIEVRILERMASLFYPPLGIVQKSPNFRKSQYQKFVCDRRIDFRVLRRHLLKFFNFRHLCKLLTFSLSSFFFSSKGAG